jgi:hypothetical protein
LGHPVMTVRVNVHHSDGVVCGRISPMAMAITMPPPAVAMVPVTTPVHLADDSRSLERRSKFDCA